MFTVFGAVIEAADIATWNFPNYTELIAGLALQSLP